MKTTTLENLLNFVLSHGNRAWIDGDKIVAVMVYTKDGAAFEEVEMVGSTMSECRNWLGY